MPGLHHALIGPAGAPVVLLLHGLGACGDDWRPQLPALVTRYRVLTVDLPGHRHSAPVDGLPSILRMAAAVEDLLDVLTIDRAHVVGLSLGGCVALMLALRAPARVRSLVVVNAFAQLRPVGLRSAVRGASRLALALGAPMRVVATYVAREAFPAPDQDELRHAAMERLAANSRRNYVGCLAALLRFDVRSRLAEIRCPTLVIAGARDTTVPFAAKALLARSIPGALLRVVDDSGHVTPLDQPAAFNRLLLDHLARLDRA
jgi:pimeloyl-ACP methyl ester carboxylesterase